MKSLDVHLFYFSSVFQDHVKKKIIETHYYKYNFNQNTQGFSFYHISNLVQMIPNVQQVFPTDRLLVGYYFYQKKQHELLSSGILLDSQSVQMVPVDLRYENTRQMESIKIWLSFLIIRFSFIRFSTSIRPKRSPTRSEKSPHVARTTPKWWARTRGRTSTLSIWYPSLPVEQSFRPLSIALLPALKVGRLYRGSGTRSVHRGTGKCHTSFSTRRTSSTHQSSRRKRLLSHQTAISWLSSWMTPVCIMCYNSQISSMCNIEIGRCDLIVQEVINHDAVIHKVYCIGSNVIVQRRKSIPNIEESNFKS